jgi:hypothetical protein
VSARTDSYPLDASKDHLDRMAHCDQVHPGTAIDVLRRDYLVFGLCPDMKWRRVKKITVHRASFTSPNVFRIIFSPFPSHPTYVRTFNKDGILLVEVPQ